jgi:hypothetical protein
MDQPMAFVTIPPLKDIPCSQHATSHDDTFAFSCTDEGTAHIDDSYYTENPANNLMIGFQSGPIADTEASCGVQRLTSEPLNEPAEAMKSDRRLTNRSGASRRKLQQRAVLRSSYTITPVVQHDLMPIPSEQDRDLKRAYRRSAAWSEKPMKCDVTESRAESRTTLTSSFEIGGSIVEDETTQANRSRATYNATIGSRISFVLAAQAFMRSDESSERTLVSPTTEG